MNTDFNAAEFSSVYPIGTPIRYYPLYPLISDSFDAEIASAAWDSKYIGVLVKLSSRSGGFQISQIKKRDWTMTEAAPEQILQFFAYEHLPEKLQLISKPFGELAKWMVETLPRNAERTAGLRKLLEAKDCAVRANLTKVPSA